MPERERGPARNAFQRLAAILAGARIVEAEALMRFAHNPESEDLYRVIDQAFARAGEYMLAHGDDGWLPPCPWEDQHNRSLCTPPFVERWLRTYARELSLGGLPPLDRPPRPGEPPY